MARAILAVALLAALLFPAAVASTNPVLPSSGAHKGAVAEGQSSSFTYASHPAGTECLAIYLPRTYTVTLAYAPVDDTLTLRVGTHSDAGAAGRASVSFVANYCTAFTITVTGTSVASTADFVTAVTSTPVVAGGPILA